jgi:hypothetical protein
MFVHLFIHADNVLLEAAETGERCVGGFYVSRTVEVDALDDAQGRVIQRLREDPTYREHVLNPRDNPPTFTFDKIEIVEERNQVNSAIVYYLGTGDPETKYYVWKPGIRATVLGWVRKLGRHLTSSC